MKFIITVAWANLGVFAIKMRRQYHFIAKICIEGWGSELNNSDFMIHFKWGKNYCILRVK